MAAQEVAQSVHRKFVLAKRGDSCWRLNIKLWGDACDGPYVVSESDGAWEVWSNSGTAAILPTEAEARDKMAKLAADWRAREVRKVYFVGPELKVGAEIKIGVAFEPRKRLATLQTGYPKPLQLLAVIEGGEHEEEKLHRRYRHARLRGEWFTITPGMKKLIERLATEEMM